MNFKYIVKTSFLGLKSHKSRSALTVLGIVIGITAIILVMSLGQGATELILGQIRGFGSQMINIEPGREPKGPSDIAGSLSNDSLKDREFQTIKKIPGVKAATPSVFGTAVAAFENETQRVSVLGSSELMAEIFDINTQEGEMFGDDDVKQYASVAVIGSKLKEDLFGEAAALRQKIKIKEKTFRVVGVLAPKGQIAAFNVDELIFIPYTTAQKYLFGTNFYNGILVQAESEEILPRLAEDIKYALREMHDITDPEKDDFHLVTQADAISMVSSITGILTAFLVSIAAISLLVGGIGIMNIMLVSVTERTREIGLRKAVGATNSDILRQFLFEAVILTSVGGVVGIAFGSGLSYVSTLILSVFVSAKWTFVFPMSAALLGFGVSAFVGFVFGIYPARQASLKSPIEALRYE